MQDASVDIAGVAEPLELDFERGTWQAARELPEGEFPLVATVAGKRYELYSDKTFAEEEVR